MEAAPFRSDLARAPEGGQVIWGTAKDGIRLRFGYWQADQPKGGILLFPGRTESIEKYGAVAADLVAGGWSVLVVDWRGQGLSDRVHHDPNIGHVPFFADYQKDVALMGQVAEKLGLPKKRFLVAHSMGGCIGLRALLNGLAVERAVFSAPMWGLQIPPYLLPLVYVVPPLARLLGQERRYAPGARGQNYVLETPFAENWLTTDAETYKWLGQIATEAPELSIGGPSIQWVSEATRETEKLLRAARPEVPVITYLGSEEAIVSTTAIHKMHKHWPSGRLEMIEGAKHEVMMETASLRERFMTGMTAFFDDGL